MKTFDVQGIGLNVPRERAFAFIADVFLKRIRVFGYRTIKF